MNEKNEHPLCKVSRKVLEDWAMMLADEVTEDEACFEANEKLYMAWIDIHGCVSGALSIVAQLQFMQTLTANLLGSDASETHSLDECEDALREMGNVLAGNYFTEAYGDDVVFDLINPHVKEIAYEELQKIAKRRVKYYFNADECPVVITFSIRE